jgi:hypothetical protein
MTRREVVDHTESQQEDSRRNRCQNNQAKINSAMQALARETALAESEVVFVGATHFGRQARNVIAPARQNLPDHGINAIFHKPLTGGYFPWAHPAPPA